MKGHCRGRRSGRQGVLIKLVTMPLDNDTVRLAKAPTLATVVTLMPDGQPQALLTWIDTDGEHVLVNTEPQRQKACLLYTSPSPRD